MTREYLVIGIEQNLAVGLYKENKDIATFYKSKKDGLYSMKANLTWYGAILMRIGLWGYNLGKKNKMMLIKL